VLRVAGFDLKKINADVALHENEAVTLTASARLPSSACCGQRAWIRYGRGINQLPRRLRAHGRSANLASDLSGRGEALRAVPVVLVRVRVR
jgi:hypothetical protein